MILSRAISNLLIAMTLASFAAQFFIDFSTINIATSTVVLLSSLFTLLYLRWSDALETHPLSSFAIFGFSFTTVIGALIVQSASWLAVSEDLRQPLVTFPLLALYQAISIFAHMLYRRMSQDSSHQKMVGIKSLLNSIRFYDVPKASDLWILGFFGLFFVLFSMILPLAKGLSFLAWAPFLIPHYYSKFGKSYCNIKVNALFMIGHAAIIVLLGMFFNSRSIVLEAFATIFLIAFLGGLRSKKAISGKLIFFSFTSILMIASLMAPVKDLVVAMAIARVDRYQVSPIKIIENTIHNFNDKGKLAYYEKLAAMQKTTSIYDETYIANPVLARLITTKFHDNAMYFSGKISDERRKDVFSLTGDFFWYMLPQPILDVLKIDIDKDFMYFSMGDVLAHYSIGTPMSGQRTGSMFGQGFFLFGSFFSIIYFCMCFIIFFTLDIFSSNRVSRFEEVSVIGMLNLWPTFLFGITAESLHHIFIVVFRGTIQSILLYLIVISIIRIIRSRSIPIAY